MIHNDCVVLGQILHLEKPALVELCGHIEAVEQIENTALTYIPYKVNMLNMLPQTE